jgi:hydroxyacylglutathione hydrolase
MGVSIHTIRLGIDHCYIIQGERVIMIDGGAPKQAKDFTKAIERLSIKPDDIKLMVLTHGHFDHIGSAKEIKDLTGAKIALHREEKGWLEKSLKPLPPGVTAWGNIFVKIMAMFMPLVHIPATNVDIVLGDGEFPLAEYGIPGKILYTPGHSMGSVSVLLETGDAFVGDLAMNMLPLRLSPGLPILAEDMQKVRESWKLLVDAGAETVYPAHGKPFSIDIIRQALF